MRNALLLLPFLAACEPSVDEPQALVGAPGVVIDKVALYQGPEIVLADGDEAVDADLPIIGGRDALLRVFYTSQRAGETLTVQLELGEGETMSQEITLLDASTDTSLASTANFRIPGDQIRDSFDYRVSFLEVGPMDFAPALHPDAGLESHPVEPPTPLKVTLVPFRYNADGSGRLPSTSSAALNNFEKRFRQLYPISDIELSVRAPVDWNGRILPNGAGWQEVIIETVNLRRRDGAASDEYYYAIFNPTRSVNEFCARGCLLGVTALNNTPSDIGDPRLRLALGVGFDPVAADTMLHELGHSHGRSHAPCGPGVDPRSVDRSYPHDGATIGGVSYDIVEDELVSESYVDVMSYCDPTWISDYNYDAIYTRMNNIRPAGQSRTVSRTEPQPSTLMIVDPDGSIRMGEARTEFPRSVGEPVQAQVLTELGTRIVEGEIVRFDHLPGGLLVLPPVGPHARVELLPDR